MIKPIKQGLKKTFLIEPKPFYASELKIIFNCLQNHIVLVNVKFES